MIPKFLLTYLGRLKFPWLFAVVAIVFGVDLIVPDVLPFADELLLGLSTLLLGAWKSRKAEQKSNQPMADVDQPEVDQPEKVRLTETPPRR